MNPLLLHPCSHLMRMPIAHRGLHSQCIPENSLGAFQWAIQCGLPIECDVHLLADNQIAVFHDHNLFRLTGIDCPIADLKGHEAIQLNIGNSDYKIPLLKEVLELVGNRVPLLIELKNHAFQIGPLEKAVVAALSHYTGEVALQSFHFASLLWLRKRAPHLCRGQLSTGMLGVPLHRLTKPHFVAYNLNSLPRPITSSLRGQNIPLIGWTVCNDGDRIKAIALADNYIFNQDARILSSLGLSPHPP